MLNRTIRHLAIPFLTAAALTTALGDAAAEPPDDTFRSGLSAYRTQDYERARTLWIDLAERGHGEAQSALGFLYLMGLRVDQSDKKAAQWFDAAAHQGVPEGQYYLGTLYLEGRGVRHNAATAHFWCELAVSLGVTDLLQAAYACSEQAARTLTREQITATARRVGQWHRAPPQPAPLKPERTM